MVKKLAIGKLRGLQQCTSRRRTFTCLALDHRQNLRRALRPSDPVSVRDADLTRFKLEVAAALADLSTAALLDPEFSAAQVVAAGVLPAGIGLVVAVESTGYTGEPTARQSQMLPGWSVEKAKRMGASMVKLLVYYHPEARTSAGVEAFVSQVVADCQKYDLALMLEPLAYSLKEDGKLSSSEKRSVVVETARRLTPLGIDVLKAEFPLDTSVDQDGAVWKQACAEISSASCVPWILLSAAVDYEMYRRQVEAACRAGASGIAVGRAVWQEAVEADGKQRVSFLNKVARPRLERLSTLCAELGRPWTDFYSAGEITPGWYKTYGERP